MSSNRLDTRQTNRLERRTGACVVRHFHRIFLHANPSIRSRAIGVRERLYRARLKADHATPEVTAQWFRELELESGEAVNAEIVEGFHKMVHEDTYDVDVPVN